MKKIINIIVLSIAVLINSNVYSQEKYAVLISCQLYDEEIPENCPFYNEPWDDTRSPEYWNDLFLIYDMLLSEKEYQEENIFIIYGNGIDWWINHNIDDRYKPEDGIPITDYSATKLNIELVLNGLVDGSNGFPQLIEDDFLFIWIFGHGEYWGPYKVKLKIRGSPYYIKDTELAAIINNINCQKKFFWLQTCRSGGFIDDFQSSNSYISTACLFSQESEPADDYPVTENEFIPDVFYTHGEYNFHMISSFYGETPTGSTSYNNEPLIIADYNSDAIISCAEAHDWTVIHDSRQEIPQQDNESLGEITSLEFPNILNYNINSNHSLRGIIGVPIDVYINSGNQLEFFQNSIVYLINGAKIIVNEGATLNLQDNVTIISRDENCIIEVQGNINIGQNVTFKSENNVNWIALDLRNLLLNLSITNANFENCGIVGVSNTLNINITDFTNSSVKYQKGSLNITGCTFINSYVDARRSNNNLNHVNILSSTFTNSPDITNSCILIDDYDVFDILSNNLQYFNSDGIALFYSGGTGDIIRRVKDCQVQCTNPVPILNKGIKVYNSNVRIENNYITGNDYGIVCLDNSLIELIGNQSASYENETQQIINNVTNQVYAIFNCFPNYFHWNAVYSNLNNNPLVYYETEFNPSNPELDVTYNYWGQNFNPNNDLYPTAWYIWDPVWNFGGSGTLNLSNSAILYDSAITNIESQNYLTAEIELKTIVTDFPQSKEAKSSLKQLFELKEIYDLDYTGLKIYYDTTSVLQSNDELGKLADWKSNFCNLKTENYNAAIIWFDNVINNPSTIDDSICAVIDLQYTYILMEEDSTNRLFTNIHNLYEVYKEFGLYRDNLIDLLLLNKKNLNAQEEKFLTPMEVIDGQVLQIYPNPFSKSTNIYYYLNENAQIELLVTDITGRKICEIINTYQIIGNHTFIWHPDNIKNGIYIIIFKVNGILKDTQKILIQ